MRTGKGSKEGNGAGNHHQLPVEAYFFQVLNRGQAGAAKRRKLKRSNDRSHRVSRKDDQCRRCLNQPAAANNGIYKTGTESNKAKEEDEFKVHESSI